MIRRKMRSPARAVSHRQRIPVHRSKNSRSRSTRLKARLLSQAPLSSARTSENASRSLLHSRQPQSKTNLHHSSRQPQSKTNLHHSSRQPQSKTSNLRGPPRPSKTRLPSLLMHRRVRVKARAAGRAARRRTNAISERITPSTPLLRRFHEETKEASRKVGVANRGRAVHMRCRTCVCREHTVLDADPQKATPDQDWQTIMHRHVQRRATRCLPLR